MKLQGKTVLVLGLGETGVSMVKWLYRQGAIVRAADTRAEPPNVADLRQTFPQLEVYTGQLGMALLGGVQLIAISPGVSVHEPCVKQAMQQGIPVVGDMALFSWAIGQTTLPKPKVIAITGSNGKTTVTSMVGAMLKKAGWQVEVAGNIGPAVLTALMRCLDAGTWPQAWVLEVSSFQLETTDYLSADVATVLNISEDHLDRYASMQDYVTAKARIFQHEHSSEGVQVLNRDDPQVLAMKLSDKKQITFGSDVASNRSDFGLMTIHEDIELLEGTSPLMRASELNVHGLHNIANALAALAICRALGVMTQPLVMALREFRGLPHRMEKVAVFNGVTFYDDSKSTNVGSAVAALSGMNHNAILIAGGDGKGQDFSALRPAVAENAKAVVLIGRDANIIASELKDCGVPLIFASTMGDAIGKSFSLAQAGDVVLLSPACASFDMFRNYIHRAEVFVAAVREIESKFVSFELQH